MTTDLPTPLRTPEELVAAVEDRIDPRHGASLMHEPRERRTFVLRCTPPEMQSLTDVLMDARRGPRENWTYEVRRLLADRFGFVPTVQVIVGFEHAIPNKLPEEA